LWGILVSPVAVPGLIFCFILAVIEDIIYEVIHGKKSSSIND